jgi:hypothetical protein
MNGCNELGYIHHPIDTNFLHADMIDFHLDGVPPHKEGRIYYDSTEHSLTVYNERPGMKLQLGREMWVYCQNQTASLIPNGTAVTIVGHNHLGPTIVPAVAADATTAMALGVTTSDLAANGGYGYVTSFGIVHDIDTSAYNAGDRLYVHPTLPGKLTSSVPEYPYFGFSIGAALAIDPVVGSIQVLMQTPPPFIDYNSLKIYSLATQDAAITNVPQPITFSGALPFGHTSNVTWNIATPHNILFNSTGIYTFLIRFSPYRSNSAGVASIQFYLRQGATSTLTRAHDVPNSSARIAIDQNIDQLAASLNTSLLINAGEYVNVMMIAAFPSGTCGIQSVPGLVETGGFITPVVKSICMSITKDR